MRQPPRSIRGSEGSFRSLSAAWLFHSSSDRILKPVVAHLSNSPRRKGDPLFVRPIPDTVGESYVFICGLSPTFRWRMPSSHGRVILSHGGCLWRMDPCVRDSSDSAASPSKDG